MRYLVASDRFFADAPGGSYRVAWTLAQEMRALGNEVALLCGSTERDPPAGGAVVDGVTIVRYRFPQVARWSPWRWQAHVAQARRAALKSLAGSPWDVVHAHSPASGTAAMQACGEGARLVVSVHSPAVLEQRINWNDGTRIGRLKLAVGLPALAHAERQLLKRADRIHVLSGFTGRALTRLYGSVVTGKITQIPWWAADPVHAERGVARTALGWPAGVTTFFTLRRLVRRMGLDLLVEAAGRQGAGVPFLVVIGGEGPERSNLEEQIRNTGVGDRVRLLGRMSDEQVSLAYAACDAFVLPTRELECFGIIAVEALSQGRPVIGSDAGAIPEILSGILPGWIFPAGDVTALAGRMAGFLSGEFRAPPDSALRANAQERYGKQRLMAEYVALLTGAKVAR